MDTGIMHNFVILNPDEDGLATDHNKPTKMSWDIQENLQKT